MAGHISRQAKEYCKIEYPLAQSLGDSGSKTRIGSGYSGAQNERQCQGTKIRPRPEGWISKSDDVGSPGF